MPLSAKLLAHQRGSIERVRRCLGNPVQTFSPDTYHSVATGLVRATQGAWIRLTKTNVQRPRCWVAEPSSRGSSQAPFSLRQQPESLLGVDQDERPTPAVLRR